jgi:hypothetical protein
MDKAIRVKKPKSSILPLPSVVDGNPFCGNEPRLIAGIVQEINLGSCQIQTVLRAGDLKCPREPSGSREVGLPAIDWFGSFLRILRIVADAES